MYLLLNPAIMRNNILQVIWKKIQELKMVRFLLTALLIVLITLAYHKPLMELYEDYIITPLLKPFESNIGVALITFFLLLACSWDIVKRWEIRYQFSQYWIGGLSFIATLLLICRFWSNYEYVFIGGPFAYVDVITLVCFAYVGLALFNCYEKEKAANDEPMDSLLEDKPIESEEEDIFDLKGEVVKIAKEIRVRNRAKTCSIAITAPWGGGKSSFLNLIRKQIDESEFENVCFVPRDSKSVQTIQEDFFSMIACVLAKYDSRCSHIIKDYMASLQLIDNRSIVERVLSLYRIWDKDSLKDSIKESFAALKKRVLVIIDDFDRLSKEEILEVLKLIDGNAAFTNLIFLTAYDKEQVNKILGDTYKTSDACFVDKFFDVEFAIPFRPYIYIAKYIEETLCKQLVASDDEREDIRRAITEHETIFKEYIPTLRDAKRYINQVLLDYEKVRRLVNAHDYLLLQIIKYRYPKLYKDVYKGRFFVSILPFCSDPVISLKSDLWSEDNKSKEVSKILPVLELLFPRKNEAHRMASGSVCNLYNFHKYFTNQIYSSLRIRDMESLFDMEWSEVEKIINRWVKNKYELKDFIVYLWEIEISPFGYLPFIRYMELLVYAAIITSNSWAYVKYIILSRYLEDHFNNNQLEVYRKRLLEIIKSRDSKCDFVRKLHFEYKRNSLKEEEYLIKDVDIWPFMKGRFQTVAADNSIDEQWLKDFLYKCIDHIEEAPRKIILDQDCLHVYRKRIERDPSFYIKKFVFLKYIYTSPDINSIACEPFCLQIFGDETQLEAFLKKCKGDKLAGSLVAWNCWQLYKANNFMPIDYSNIAPVNEMIKNDLVEEVKMLDKMKQIEKVIYEINIEHQTLTSEEMSKLPGLLSKNRQELKNIQLPIALKEKILNEIDFKLKLLSQIEKAQER